MAPATFAFGQTEIQPRRSLELRWLDTADDDMFIAVADDDIVVELREAHDVGAEAFWDFESMLDSLK